MKTETKVTESYNDLSKVARDLPITAAQQGDIMSKALKVAMDYYDRGVNNTKINYGIK